MAWITCSVIGSSIGYIGVHLRLPLEVCGLTQACSTLPPALPATNCILPDQAAAAGEHSASRPNGMNIIPVDNSFCFMPW